MSLIWNTDPIKKLENLKPSKERQVLRKSVRKAAIVVRQDLRGAVPVRTGSLKRSLIVKIGTTKQELVVFAIIGPSKKFKGPQIYTSRSGEAVYAQPRYYGWILDKGTKYITGRKFLQTTWNSGRNKYLDVVKRTAGEEYQKLIGA